VAKIYSLKAGARIPDDILAIAKAEKISTARVEAIGGVEELRLAYFNSGRSATRSTISGNSSRSPGSSAT
jgi:predicted DNA-binding protein with PD1-like motif